MHATRARLAVRCSFRSLDESLDASLLNLRAFVGAAQIEAEEGELSMEEGRLRLVLKGGGTVTWPPQAQVEVVTGPYERLQRDEGLTRMQRPILVPLPRPRVMILGRG